MGKAFISISERPERMQCCRLISKCCIVAQDVETRADNRVYPPVECGVIRDPYPTNPGPVFSCQATGATEEEDP